MAIKCCNGCVPPKRTPTCKFDGSCNEYAEAKAKHDAEKAAENKKKAVESGLASQALKRSDRARKEWRKLKGR